jgi:hypothetical protein
MSLIVPLAALFGLEADAIVDQVKRNAIAYGAVAFFALVGIVFALMAAHIALSEGVGALGSALILGGVALAIALTIFIVLRVGADIEKRRRAARRRSSETTALVTTAALTAVPMLLGSRLVRNAAVPAAVLGGIGLLVKAALEANDAKEPD